MNPETRTKAAAWLAKARIDLRAARADLKTAEGRHRDRLAYRCRDRILNGEERLISVAVSHRFWQWSRTSRTC